jgi:hypothetical protein
MVQLGKPILPALALAALELVAATPTPPTRVETYATKTRRWYGPRDKRDFLDDVKNSIESDLSKLGSAIPSYVADGKCPTVYGSWSMVHGLRSIAHGQ